MSPLEDKSNTCFLPTFSCTMQSRWWHTSFHLPPSTHQSTVVCCVYQHILYLTFYSHSPRSCALLDLCTTRATSAATGLTIQLIPATPHSTCPTACHTECNKCSSSLWSLGELMRNTKSQAHQTRWIKIYILTKGLLYACSSLKNHARLSHGSCNARPVCPRTDGRNLQPSQPESNNSMHCLLRFLTGMLS